MNAKITRKPSGAALQGWRQRLSDFWSERNARERRLLVAGATIVVLGLFYALLLDPALSGRTDLEKKLPALRQQAAEVRALSREAGTLQSAAATPAPVLTRESIDNALSRKGLKAQNVALTGEVVKLQFAGASFSGLIDWLAEMQRTARLSVLEATVEGQAEADTVNATLTLRQQRSESAQ